MLRFPIGDELGRVRGAWVVVSYEQSFASRPVRPLFVMTRTDRPSIEAALPAAILGRASWLTLVPEDLVEAELRFDLDDPARIRLLPPRVVPVWRLRRRLASRDPLGAFLDLLPADCHSRRARSNIMRAGTRQLPLARFADFAAERSRALEPEGFDRPAPADLAPAIGLVVTVAAGRASLLARTVDSALGQADPAWRLTIRPDDDAAWAAARALPADPRIAIVREPGASASGSGQADPDWIGWIEAGERLAPFAILSARAEIRDRPGLSLLYTDGARADAGGTIQQPVFLPGWSPTYLRAVDYVDGLCLASGAFAQAAAARSDRATNDPRGAVLRHAAATLGRAEVSHLPRLALVRDAAEDATRRAAVRTGPREPARAPGSPGSDRVSIVIPTRDRLDLLRPAVETLLGRTQPGGFELIVADNGSEDEKTLAFLRGIDGRDRTRVLRVEGPFNFSRVVNAGVAASRGEVVVLLNNDVEIVRPDWLSEMLACMTEPDVGAVGAQLLYPNGKVQHMGTVVGLWGYAGHFGRLRQPDAPGHLGRLSVPYEVSAVTAACLAVRRSHFDAVDGFDESYAVAFNDVDFCLRLQERGLRNLMQPRAVLTHRETASRGRDIGARRARFRDERTRFGERWRSVMQDDPSFHLGLALYTTTDRLE